MGQPHSIALPTMMCSHMDVEEQEEPNEEQEYSDVLQFIEVKQDLDPPRIALDDPIHSER